MQARNARTGTLCLVATLLGWCAVAFGSTGAQPGASGADVDASENGARLQRLFAQLGEGGLPRDQALHWQLGKFLPTVGGASSAEPAELRAAAKAAPRDRLVQWTWSMATDAEAGCVSATTCKERESALARLEPDNSVAWWPALSAAARRGDEAEVTRVLGRMARASRHEDVFIDSAEAWYAAQALVPLMPGELAQLHTDMTADSAAIISGIALSAAMAAPSLQAIANACDATRRPAAVPRAADCATVGRGMQADGNTMIVRHMGHLLLARSGGETVADQAAYQRNLALEQQRVRFGAAAEAPAELRRYFDDLLATRSEYIAMERQVLRLRGVTEPSGAPR